MAADREHCYARNMVDVRARTLKAGGVRDVLVILPPFKCPVGEPVQVESIEELQVLLDHGAVAAAADVPTVTGRMPSGCRQSTRPMTAGSVKCVFGHQPLPPWLSRDSDGGHGDDRKKTGASLLCALNVASQLNTTLQFPRRQTVLVFESESE